MSFSFKVEVIRRISADQTDSILVAAVLLIKVTFDFFDVLRAVRTDPGIMNSKISQRRPSFLGTSTNPLEQHFSTPSTAPNIGNVESCESLTGEQGIETRRIDVNDDIGDRESFEVR